MHFAWQNASNRCNLLFMIWGGGSSFLSPSMAITRLCPQVGICRDFPAFHVSPPAPPTGVPTLANSVGTNFGIFRRRVFALKFHTILIFNSCSFPMNYLLFLCVCFLCVSVWRCPLLVVLKVACFFLLLATWLLTQHINKQEFNWIIIIRVTIINTIIQNGNSWNKMYNKL